MPDSETVVPIFHNHVFLGASHRKNERRTWVVIGLCAFMMIVEIVAGSLFGSLALIADGLHMSTHAGALLLAAIAYTYARKHAADPSFAFGTGKIGDLAGYTSAVILAMFALLIGYEAVARLMYPIPIDFAQAIPIAAIGLLVNIASAWLLSHRDHERAHGHRHVHGRLQDHNNGRNGDGERPPIDLTDDCAGAQIPEAHERDNNMRAAFIHVLADAAMSVFVIAGLLLARSFNWTWIDPLIGLGGAGVIANWSYALMRDTGSVLLDRIGDRPMMDAIRGAIEIDGDRLNDLHLWRLGPGHLGLIVSIATTKARDPEYYQALLQRFPGLSHITVEVRRATWSKEDGARAA